MARPRRPNNGATAAAVALLDLVDRSGLSDKWICERAGVGKNYLSLLRGGEGGSLPFFEKIAHTLGYTITLEPTRYSPQVSRRIAEIARARDRRPRYIAARGCAVPPAMEADWRLLKRKRFTNAEAAQILGIPYKGTPSP